MSSGNDPKNPNSSDFSHVAKDFMGLWQQNMEAMTKDPAMMQMAAPFLQQFFSLNSGHDKAKSSDKPSQASCATAAGPEPDVGNELLHQLSVRLEELEQRLTDLESKVSDQS